MIYALRIAIDDDGIGVDMSRVGDNPILQGIADKLMKEEENVELYF